MIFNKKLVSAAVGAALGLGCVAVASADAIVSIKIEDVGSTTGCSTNNGVACAAPVYSSVLDSESGLFRFNTINPGTATSTAYSSWTGNVGTGTIAFQGATSATGSFSTGFLFSGAPFVPFVADGVLDLTVNGGGAVGDITGGVLSISNLAFGGNFGGVADFDLPPDPGTLFVNWVVATGPNTYKVSFQWSHTITGTGSSYDGFNARWLVEGTATTAAAAVPVPAAAWLFGSGLVGLAAVARRRKKA